MEGTQKIRGFTLTELVVVIGIIGLLSAIILGTLTIGRTKARDARRIADLHEIRVALSLYYSNNGKFPYCLSGCTAPLEGSTFMESVPRDPKTGNNYSYAALNPGCTSYHLGAQLEDKTNQALRSDSDAPAQARCSDQSSSDFSGLTYSTAGVCNGSAGIPQPSTAANGESCYDIAP